ncbi:hypothetical protein B0T22DRAFT_294228 [Podospora appendiculata]|uniref:C2H2-type domain-containing protein n=1 Tax=Podospora appendiculata TaxID=314037 RepID=A0AAE0X1P3_9PEZI|nr:hypothetical protein B0T22DRAFT_294228 [Podospora appendiculata]
MDPAHEATVGPQNLKTEADGAIQIEFVPQLEEQTSLKPSTGPHASDEVTTKPQPPPPSSARSSIASFASKSSVASNRYSIASSRLSSASMLASGVLEDAAWTTTALPQQPLAHPVKMYCCTSCDTKFARKIDWKRHEIEFHERESCYPCPEPGCDRVFWAAHTFNGHHRYQHGCNTCPHSETVVKTLRKRTGRGCGFCGAFFSSVTRYFDHVAHYHFEDTATTKMWQHSLVIYGLLHSQRLHDAWRRAITALPVGFRLEWNVKTSGRLDGYPELGSSLQDELEYFDGTEEEAEILVQKALGLARVIVPETIEPVSGIRFIELNGALPGHRVQTYPDGEFSSIPYETVECVGDPVDAGEEPRPSADDGQDKTRLSAPCKKVAGSNSNSESESSYEDESDSFDSADGFDGQDQKKSVAERAVRTMVDRVMSRFWTLLEQDSFMTDASEPQSSESSCSPQQPQLSQARGRGNKARGAVPKRRRDDDDVWDNDDNGEPSTPPHAPTKKPGRQTSPKFACPFRKHDPVKFSIHSHKICALTPWPSIARLKEHLYRSHKQPPYCKRCCETFSTSQELEQHMMVAAAEICAVQLREPPPGITPEHIERLRSKKKPARNYSDGERWQDIYKLLFPDVTDIPSPYFELLQDIGGLSLQSQDIMEYQAYLRAELPRLVRQCLEQEAQRQVQPLELALLESLPGIIQRCQETAFSAFQQEHTNVRAPRVEVAGEYLSAQIASAAPPRPETARQAPSDSLQNTTDTLAYDFASTTQPSFDAQVTPTLLADPGSQIDSASNQVRAPSVISTSTVSGMGYLSDGWQDVDLGDFGYIQACRCVGPCRCMDAMLGYVNTW